MFMEQKIEINETMSQHEAALINMSQSNLYANVSPQNTNRTMSYYGYNNMSAPHGRRGFTDEESMVTQNYQLLSPHMQHPGRFMDNSSGWNVEIVN
jgi:hypothetical protein